MTLAKVRNVIRVRNVTIVKNVSLVKRTNVTLVRFAWHVKNATQANVHLARYAILVRIVIPQSKGYRRIK